MDKKLELISQKKINIINFICGLYIFMIPLFKSLIDLFNVYLHINVFLILFFAFYSFFFLILVVNCFIDKDRRNKFKAQFKNPVFISLVFCIFWLFLSATINGVFNIDFFITLSYFYIFFSIYFLPKEYKKKIFNIGILIVAISCLLGIIDPHGHFVPGFYEIQYSLSLQFRNPNHSAYIVSIIIITLFNIINKDLKKSIKIYYFVLYYIFAIFLFLNGSYSPIFAVLVVEIFEVIFLGCKFKKFPTIKFILLISLFAIMFLVDLYPNVENVRTCNYNFFLESIAVFDNIFGTNLLKIFNISYIPGADGWSRKEFIYNSLCQVTSSTKNFLFGFGAGHFNSLRPHHIILCLWIDFGIIPALIFISMLVYFIVRICKSKFGIIKFGALSCLIVFTIIMNFGSIFSCSFVYFIFLFVILYDLINDKKVNLGNIKEHPNIE